MPVHGTPPVRTARATDADAVFELACVLATSFVPTRRAFDATFAALQPDEDARLLVAEDRAGAVAGYLLGFAHATFFANGTVTWIEEMVVRPDRRGCGLGRALVARFEDWSHERGANLMALATRRAEDFYGALGFERSAVYYRKRLTR